MGGDRMGTRGVPAMRSGCDSKRAGAGAAATKGLETESCEIDDAFVHDAWNDSDRERVVFIVDLWHPDLSDDEVALLEGLHGHVAGHAANLRSYWERNDEVRRAAL